MNQRLRLTMGMLAVTAALASVPLVMAAKSSGQETRKVAKRPPAPSVKEEATSGV